MGLSCRNVRSEKTQLLVAWETTQAETPATGPCRHLTPRRPPLSAISKKMRASVCITSELCLCSAISPTPTWKTRAVVLKGWGLNLRERLQERIAVLFYFKYLVEIDEMHSKLSSYSQIHDEGFSLCSLSETVNDLRWCHLVYLVLSASQTSGVASSLASFVRCAQDTTSNVCNIETPWLRFCKIAIGCFSFCPWRKRDWF